VDNNQIFQVIKRKINGQYDIPDMILSAMVIRCINEKGKMPNDIRAIYRDKGVSEEVFDFAENAYTCLFTDEK